jgi:hypothetical protein
MLKRSESESTFSDSVSSTMAVLSDSCVKDSVPPMHWAVPLAQTPLWSCNSSWRPWFWASLDSLFQSSWIRNRLLPMNLTLLSVNFKWWWSGNRKQSVFWDSWDRVLGTCRTNRNSLRAHWWAEGRFFQVPPCFWSWRRRVWGLKAAGSWICTKSELAWWVG